MSNSLTKIAVHRPNVWAGAFKFRHSHMYRAEYQVTEGQLLALADKLIVQNPGGGTFHRVYIRDTGHHELGLCFIYTPGPEELEKNKRRRSRRDHPHLDKYIEFFKNNCPTDAFKGFDVGHEVTEFTLGRS